MSIKLNKVATFCSDLPYLETSFFFFFFLATPQVEEYTQMKPERNSLEEQKFYHSATYCI